MENKTLDSLRYSEYTAKFEIRTQSELDTALQFRGSRVFFMGKLIDLQYIEKAALHETLSRDIDFQKEWEIHVAELVNLVGTSNPNKPQFIINISTYLNQIRIASQEKIYSDIDVPYGSIVELWELLTTIKEWLKRRVSNVLSHFL